MRKLLVLVSLSLSIILLISACNFPRPTATPVAGGEDSIQTSAALTVEALLSTDAPTDTPAGPEASLTPVPTNTINPAQPSATSPATATPEASATPEVPCDRFCRRDDPGRHRDISQWNVHQDLDVEKYRNMHLEFQLFAGICQRDCHDKHRFKTANQRKH